MVDFSKNGLSGDISIILSSIKIMNNSLRGDLLIEFGTYPRLAIVDLTSNELTGPIPSSFFTSLSLINLNTSGNNFMGNITLQGSRTTELLVLPSYSQLESLDFSGNSLTGSLPSELGKLGKLRLLNLARNSLSGEIPSAMSKLNGLEYLDLSNNNFNGKIPDGLPSSLKDFNVSYNYLSGQVPKKLVHFPNTSFHHGNTLLIFANTMPSQSNSPMSFNGKGQHHSSKSNIRVAFIIASVSATLMIAFVLLVYYHGQFQQFPRKKFVAETAVFALPKGREACPESKKCYWGPREQERLVPVDYIHGDNLSLHLYGKIFQQLIFKLHPKK
uniref:Uncharacterized protein n=1 Tax=Nelumbo nucifera TaxID=4432 RepID=A0A822Z6K3_NELNU|nr:TPA_asm: hypothetical protein HUJ06_007809 [Nelumbo nucifera]